MMFFLPVPVLLPVPEDKARVLVRHRELPPPLAPR